MGSPPQPEPAWTGMVDLAVLETWMDGQGLGSGSVERAQALAGGTQNLLLKFERAGRAYVLRRPPRHLRDNSSETMRREARMLAALAGSDVPHPGLIAACPDETVIGAAFYLMEPIDGFNPTTGLPPFHAGDPPTRSGHIRSTIIMRARDWSTPASSPCPDHGVAVPRRHRR